MTGCSTPCRMLGRLSPEWVCRRGLNSTVCYLNCSGRDPHTVDIISPRALPPHNISNLDNSCSIRYCSLKVTTICIMASLYEVMVLTLLLQKSIFLIVTFGLSKHHNIVLSVLTYSLLVLRASIPAQDIGSYFAKAEFYLLPGNHKMSSYILYSPCSHAITSSYRTVNH